MPGDDASPDALLQAAGDDAAHIPPVVIGAPLDGRVTAPPPDHGLYVRCGVGIKL
jgi:hypothetical protein